MLYRSFTIGLACLCCVSACMAEKIVDDFSGYSAERFQKDSPWKDRAYGHHPSVVLAEENGNWFMQAAGGGDRHVYRQFEPSVFSSILKKKNFVLEFKNRDGIGLGLGSAGKYSYGEQFDIRANGSIILSFKKRQYYGILKFAAGDWTAIRVMFRKEGKNIFVTAAYRPEKAEKFIIDPELKEIGIPASEFHFKLWNGVNMRLDGSAGFDDFSISGFDSDAELPADMETGKVEIPMRAITDHVIAPRAAQDLSGIWDYSVNEENKAGLSWKKVAVPEYHSSLVNGARKKGVLFRRFFDLSAIQPGKRYLLRFERVCLLSKIYVNGKMVKESRNGWFPFSADCTDAVREGRNELIVEVYAPNSIENSAKKYPQGWGWYLSGYAGIPYPVHLETCGEVHVSDVFVIPRVGGTRRLEAEVTLRNDSASPRGILLGGRVGDEFAFSPVSVTLPPKSSVVKKLSAPWKNPRLWWPHDPHLYHLDLTVAENGKTVDACRQEFGFREVCVRKERMYLNGIPFLHRRDSAIVNWKQTTENGRLIREQFRFLKQRGFNGLRLHSSPNLRYIREADRAGMLLSPESGVNEPRGDTVMPEYWPRAEEHLLEMVKAYRNHPSIIYWCISNEFAGIYMKGTREERAVVDARMTGFGNKMVRLDPTRTWTASGDGELGGQGGHGPAPTLSFHYAWQPFKQSNMLPNTAYWLEKGLFPWQGIVWDRTKPIILSEDMFHPYCLKPPHGMAWWAGNAAYDIRNGGAFKAWHDAYRMLADGYYYSGVSGWNPWAVFATTPENPLFALGPLMPDWLIAVRQFNTGVSSGASVSREIFCCNQTFETKNGVLRSVLLDGKKELASEVKNETFSAGKRSSFSLSLKMPEVRKKTNLLWKLSLESGGKILAEKNTVLTVYPKNAACKAPVSTALLDPGKKIGADLGFDKGRFDTVSGALNAHPRNLVIASANLTNEDGKRVEQFVRDGGNVLILELDPDGWKPQPCDKRFKAAFAFVRSPHDPVMKNIGDEDLRLWDSENISVKGAFRKASAGSCDILADCGLGQEMAALMRVTRGRGTFLLCQMPVVSSAPQDPAAAYVLRELIRGFTAGKHVPKQIVTIVEGPEKRIENGFRKMGFRYQAEGNSGLLFVDGTEKWAAAVVSRLENCLKNGGTVVVDRPGAENVEDLNRIAGDDIRLEPSREWIFNTAGEPELDGVSNSDLLWAKNPEQLFERMIIEQIRRKTYAGKELPMADSLIRTQKGVPLLNPCAAVVWRLKRGRLIVSSLNWITTLKKGKAARVMGTLLRNLGGVISKSEKRNDYRPVELKKSMNRAFWHRPQEGRNGWFGNEKDDMRYFPVNVTGIDPDLHVPAPVEKFPAGLRNFGGIDFELVDPESNGGKGCVILKPGETLTLKTGGKFVRLWFLGASGTMLPKGKAIAGLRWSGLRSAETIRAGFELNGYQYISECETGTIGWIGRNPARHDAVMWVWSVNNPHPENRVESVKITARVPLALVAVTEEQ